MGIAVDRSGDPYVAGESGSTDFPAVHPFQDGTGRGGAFVAKLDPTGSALVYASRFGTGAVARAIAVDGAGDAYVAGVTQSSSIPDPNLEPHPVPFPTTPGAFEATNGEGRDGITAFMARLDTTLSGPASLTYATYLGGTHGSGNAGADWAYGIAVDRHGDAYLTGNTYATDFPVKHAFQPALQRDDAFVAKLDPSKRGRASLVYSTYLGGSAGAQGNSVAVDRAGRAYVAGITQSTDFPVRGDPCVPQARSGGVHPISGDAFVSVLSADGSSLVWSTLLGGSGRDEARSIALAANGDVDVAGETGSPDFPTRGAYQTVAPPDAEAQFLSVLRPGSCSAFEEAPRASRRGPGSGLPLNPPGPIVSPEPPQPMSHGVTVPAGG